MKSIKPGRGPSMMGGIAAVFAAVFGVAWMIIAFSIGAGAFSLFGLIFIAMAVISAIYNFKNATSDSRFSEFDITDDGEEPDPLNEYFGRKNASETPSDNGGEYCPYCGAKTGSDYAFCRKCGRKL